MSRRCVWSGLSRSRPRPGKLARSRRPAPGASACRSHGWTWRRWRNLSYFQALARAFPDQVVGLQGSGEGLDMDRLVLCLEMVHQQFGGAHGLLACPLHQAIDGSLVESARGAVARLVVQAFNAYLVPTLPGLAHGADVVRSCTLVTSRLSMGWHSSSKVLASSRARQSGDFLTTCSSAIRSSSLSRLSSRLPIRIARRIQI